MARKLLYCCNRAAPVPAVAIRGYGEDPQEAYNQYVNNGGRGTPDECEFWKEVKVEKKEIIQIKHVLVEVDDAWTDHESI